MSSLRDELGGFADYPAADEPKYSAQYEFDAAQGTGTLSTGPMPIEEDFNFADTMRRFNKDPALYEIEVAPSETIWEQRARNRETNEFETTLLHAWKNARFRRKGSTSSADIEAIALRAKPKPRLGQGSYWFVFQGGDQQLGKRSRDGSTEQIIQRYVESVERAAREFRNVERCGIEGVQISMPGDCIEGNQSQGGKNLWLTQETVTEQTRILRRLMMHTVEQFAPLVDRVCLDVVNGNHDEAQRTQNTYPGDGWATEAAIAVSDALKQNPAAYRHVTVRVPEKWSGAMTVPVGDTIVAVVHGHQWRTNAAMKWWAEQALGNQPAAGAQILQHGHWHQWAIESTADRVRICSPTYDCGSDWFRNRRGSESRRGGLTYLLRGGEVSRMSVV